MTSEPAVEALDLETFLIENGLLAPPVVCGSTASRVGGRLLASGETRAEKVAHVLAFARALLGRRSLLAGANIAYDFGCLLAEDPDLLLPVFAAYADGRVHDVQIAQTLHAVACGDLGRDPQTGATIKGRYSLDRCVQLVLGRGDAKARDRWRLMYGVLAEVPVEDWPDDARQYPVDDASNTFEVAEAQLRGGGDGPTPGPHQNLADLPAQCETAFALHLGAMSGVRVDPGAVRALRARVEREHAEFLRRHARFFRPDGKEDGAVVKRAVAVAYAGALPPCPRCVGGKTLSERTGNAVLCKACAGTGLELSDAVPRTPRGGVRTDRDALVESGDPDLAAYGDNEPEKIRGTYLPWLESGLDKPLTFRPNVLVLSGRTSYDGLVQLTPREGGVRECIRARGRWSGLREDLVFCSADYAAIELCTLAQVCLWVLGHSRMADVICETGDPGMLHTSFGASLVGWSVDEMVSRLKAGDKVAKNSRWAAKACNFGSPGGMGSAKFVLAQRLKSAGKTTTADGAVTYQGLRFCVLLAGAERCGVEKVSEWRGRPVPPICRACVELVDRELRPAWFREWPEIKSYHAWVSAQVDAGGVAPCLVPGPDGVTSVRVRGGLDFTNFANTLFQGLAADGAKAAFRALTRECYLGQSTTYDAPGAPPRLTFGPPPASDVWRGGRSPLLGCRLPLFVHDEVVAEVPLSRAHEAATRVVEVMTHVMRAYVPDVPIRAEAALMFRLSKSAEARRDAAGRLVPWDESEVTYGT